MSRTAPVVAAARYSVRADVRDEKLNLLRTTCRATQLVRKVFVQRAMIWAELFNQGVDIKTFTVVAPVAVSGQQIPVPFEITQRCDRSRSIHDSLQGWLSYTVNNQRTNHNLKQEGFAIRNHAF
ncbi:hypothetical protein [Brucella anthropi]|uniref:hypothetical protein n=1 Tax=Brucella anthropi TaxID=529 RepID=UPI0002DA3280|nr:hypothetical protein [Brucella anthropi]